LLCLILAPEAYLPLRNVGAQFHATADGLAAAEQAFTILETPVPAAVSYAGLGGITDGTMPRHGLGVRVERVSVRHEGRSAAAPDRVSLAISPGRLTALAGPSGCGKSTLLAVLLGFARPDEGRVLITARSGLRAGSGEADLGELDPDHWRSMIGWVPQDPTLFPGTVADNIRLGWPDAPDEAVRAAARAAALTGDGPGTVPLDRVLADRGAGLSAGQRRRVALARALLPRPDGTRRPVLLLDEPTAGLDAAAEARVIATLRAEAARGRAILVVSHHPAVVAAADEVVAIPGAAPVAQGAAIDSAVPPLLAEVPA
jgi:ABC-type transport system involved in cytochrome bd biosynthesis fused ATPase/permease subunit